MAFTAGMVVELRTSGNDANGGGYVTGAGTDYSQQDAAQLTVSDGVTNGTTTVTSAAGGFTAAMVNNCINIAGTFYQIATRVDTNTITVDRTASAATGQAMRVGGALASPGMVGRLLSNGSPSSWIVWQKSGTYLLNSITANVTLGVFSTALVGTVAAPAKWSGYDSVRGDLNGVNGGNRPLNTTTLAVAVVVLITTSGVFSSVENVTCTNGSGTGTASTGISAPTVINCRCDDFTNSGIIASVLVMESEVRNCAINNPTGRGGFALAVAGTLVLNCVARDCPGQGFQVTNSRVLFSGCAAYNNGQNGFNGGNLTFNAINCLADGNAGAGFYLSNAAGGSVGRVVWTNCIGSNNGGAGFSASSSVLSILIQNCAGYNNTGGNYSGAIFPDSGLSQVMFNFKALSADPFTNRAGLDFSLNSAASGGALLRAAGFPSTLPGLAGTSYGDIGIYQTQGGGGGGKPGIGSSLIGRVHQ